MLGVLEGDYKRRRREIEDRRVLQHELATLVAFAFHQPSKMPDYKPPAEASAPPARKAETACDTDHERVRGLLIGMALRGRG
ncbi:hypothetical protein APX01_01075 [Cereibacter sphaeroides]|uniref:hypothetical protein n=1 Tax=Cereibacter sphaeroides TaxID=1063 RepID=UPI00003792F0|nr:hypothetical protein [Cereibacter sphaeroides]AMJ46176.1 hypothetical protein APX01_01075 [Cereibacter sphaeroides]ANS32888.1 hypothetical protein A3858_01075 [Cereibacter sphaeroides]ATN61940.1 hypothetical protein A3857_01075 [Cereibacter sphaeroides]QJC84998.1 hypothetical protein HGN32_12710 [Cereibacter sphaeroides]